MANLKFQISNGEVSDRTAPAVQIPILVRLQARRVGV